jgi:hypothetical protein
MRTKTTLVAAAILAAGLASSMAQNVYSLNVVGYVNVNLVPGFNAVSSQLVGNPDNNLNTVFTGSTIPDTTLLFKWNTTTGDFDAVIPSYSTTTHTWTPNIALEQGLGYFVYAPSAFTQTFVGEVKQTPTTTQIVPGFNVIGSPVPISGNAGTIMTGMTPTDTDLVLKWNPAGNPQDFYSTPSQYSSALASWSTPANSTFDVGEGLLYFSAAGANVNWVRNFTVAP